MKIINLLPESVQTILKGLVATVLGAIVAVVAPSIESGTFIFDWTTIWHTGVAAGLAYLGKQIVYPKPNTIQIDPSKTSVVDKTTKEVIIDSGRE